MSVPKVLWITAAIALAIVVYALLATTLSPGRWPDKYLVPAGYVGWLIIEYGVKGAPPAPVEDGYKVYRFPPSGRLKTSSPIEYGSERGVSHDEYDYVTPHGLTPIGTDWPGDHPDSAGLIRGDGGVRGSLGAIPVTQVQFIGTKSDYDKADAGPEPKSEEEEARDKAFDAKDAASENTSNR